MAMIAIIQQAEGVLFGRTAPRYGPYGIQPSIGIRTYEVSERGPPRSGIKRKTKNGGRQVIFLVNWPVFKAGWSQPRI